MFEAKSMGGMEDTMLALHDLSMATDDPVKGAYGRLGKLLFAAVDTWLQDEKRRGTPSPACVVAAMSIHLSLIGTIIQSTAKPGHAAQGAQELRPHIIEAYDALVASMKEAGR